MSGYHYTELHKSKVEQDVQLAYADEIREIRALGFEEEYYICEDHGPLSFLLKLDLVLRAKNKGIIVRRGPQFALVVYMVIAIHEEGYVYATATKDFVKFVTLFDDRTMVYSTTFTRHFLRSIPEEKFICQRSLNGTVTDAWQLHQKAVHEIANQGKSVVSLASIQHATRIEQRVDEFVNNGTAKAWDREELRKTKQK